MARKTTTGQKKDDEMVTRKVQMSAHWTEPKMMIVLLLGSTIIIMECVVQPMVTRMTLEKMLATTPTSLRTELESSRNSRMNKHSSKQQSRHHPAATRPAAWHSERCLSLACSCPSVRQTCRALGCSDAPPEVVDPFRDLFVLAYKCLIILKMSQGCIEPLQI